MVPFSELERLDATQLGAVGGARAAAREVVWAQPGELTGASPRCSRRDEAVSCEFSVGWAVTDKECSAIGAIPARVWADAVDADGGHRDGAGLPGSPECYRSARYPAGTRVIVRRQQPPSAGSVAFTAATAACASAIAAVARPGGSG